MKPTPPPLDVSAELARLRLERTKLTQRATSAFNTERGYAYDWRMWERWAESMNLPALPATSEAVSLYITSLLAAGKKTTTSSRRASAIARIHRDAGFPSPVIGEVQAVLRGARRNRTETTREMLPLSLEQLRAITDLLTTEETPLAMRDRAILVTGFASALRRSSLVELQLRDAEFTDGGVVLHIRREKQDQFGNGRMIGLPRGMQAGTCPVRCLDAWIQWRGNAPGPLFTHVHKGGKGYGLKPEAIERMVKRCVVRIGLDPDNYAGHSLRSSFITEAAERGLGELQIAATSGHRSMSVLRKYFRKTNLWKANPSGMIGL